MPRYRRVQNITHQIGSQGALVISVSSAEVRLVATEGPDAQIHATFEVDAKNEADADAIFEAAKLQVETAEGRLSVGESGWRGFGAGLGFGAALGRLVVSGRQVDLEAVDATAPAGCRLELHVVSGDVQATGFVGSQRYQTVSGDLRIVDSGGELVVDSVSGDISLRAVRPVSLKANTVSGDLSAQAPSYGQLRANAVSGDVSVDGAIDPRGAHTVDTVSGDFRLASGSGMTVAVRGLSSDIHSSVPHRVEGSAELRRLIVGDGAASVTFNSMSGDLALTRSRQQSTVALEPVDPAVTPGAAPDERIAVLAALERGEISVDEALRRLGSVR